MHWMVNGNDNCSGVGNADLDPVAAATSDAAYHWLDQAIQVLEQLPSASDWRRWWTEELKHMQHVLHHNLTQAMQFFMAFCQEHLSIMSSLSLSLSSSTCTYKAHIYASRGPTLAKCLVWHVDQVPVHYIWCWPILREVWLVTQLGMLSWSLVWWWQGRNWGTHRKMLLIIIIIVSIIHIVVVITVFVNTGNVDLWWWGQWDDLFCLFLLGRPFQFQCHGPWGYAAQEKNQQSTCVTIALLMQKQ